MGFLSFTRGCSGSSESTLVKMPRWKSHVAAHIYYTFCKFFVIYDRREEGEPSPFEEPLLKEIADKTGKSIAQVRVYVIIFISYIEDLT